MKIPKTLKVGGHIYKIIDGYVFRERTDIHGQCDHSNLEIRLCRFDLSGKFAESKVECDFIHEMLHAIDNTYNGAQLKEEDVVRLAEGLYQVLTDNGLLK